MNMPNVSISFSEVASSAVERGERGIVALILKDKIYKDKNGNFMKTKEGEYIQVASMQDIQYLGALNTYYKRYLYLNAFGITDGEIIDSMNNNELSKENESNYRKELINYCKENGIDMNKVAKDYKLVGRKLSNDDYYDVLCEVKGENNG